jgi:hypothetical protein
MEIRNAIPNRRDGILLGYDGGNYFMYIQRPQWEPSGWLSL